MLILPLPVRQVRDAVARVVAMTTDLAPEQADNVARQMATRVYASELRRLPATAERETVAGLEQWIAARLHTEAELVPLSDLDAVAKMAAKIQEGTNLTPSKARQIAEASAASVHDGKKHRKRRKPGA